MKLPTTRKITTDIKHETLETTIAEETGIPYLSKAAKAGANEVAKVGIGYIHGLKRQVEETFLFLGIVCAFIFPLSRRTRVGRVAGNGQILKFNLLHACGNGKEAL